MFSVSTIFALASAAGRGGVAVFRLSGPQAGICLTQLTGQALPPPRHCGTDLSPCLAPPVPFCLYIFLPVTLTSERSCA